MCIRDSFWILLLLAIAATLLWLRILRWSASFEIRICLLALTLGYVGVMQALKLQQMSLVVAGLVAFAIALLVTDQPVAAGYLLALATIKPQLMVLLVFWLAVWTLADWRRRYRLAVSFLVTMAILIAASEWYLPHWIPRFWHAVREYQRYTGAVSVMDTLLGAPWSWALELLAFVALIVACWRERRQPANSGAFAFMISLVLATTIFLVPTSAPYNQVLLIPAFLVLVKERRTIWQRSRINRLLFTLTACLVGWQWVASTALAGLSFVLPPQTVQQAWAVPFWTTTQIPVGVAALMLAHYYQTTFTVPARPSPS